MDHSGKKDPKLNEVKAVLQRLQGITTELEPAGAQSTGASPQRRRQVTAIAAGVIVFAGAAAATNYMLAPRAPPERPTAPKAGVSAKASPPAATRTVAVTPLPDVTPPLAPANAAGQLPQRPDPTGAAAVKQVLEATKGLMARGRVRAAREQLLSLAGEGSPDVAWALARSYDPNVLVQVPTADADADIKEATRWYRAWYAAAVGRGDVADSVSLERIIGSMRE